MTDPKPNTPPSAAPAGDPFAGLKAFYREHGMFMNQLTLSVTTLCGALDFFVPSHPELAFASRVALGVVILLMLIAVKRPNLAHTVLAFLGASATGVGGVLWRNRRWQATVSVLLLAVFFLGESQARANQGGVVASQVRPVRDLQQKLLQQNTALK